MALDPELLKQLIESFSTELNEYTQTITNGLLALEKSHLTEDEQHKITESIFRAAHNIKGTARSLGINSVGEIAHRVESIFSAIQKKSLEITPVIIDVCLDAVDKMRSALDAYVNNQPLPFDLNTFIQNLESRKVEKIAPREVSKEIQDNVSHASTEYESIRVPVSKIDKISSLLEDVQANKIAIDDHYSQLTQLMGQVNEFSYLWKQIFSQMKNVQLYQSANDFFSDISESIQSMHKRMRANINELSLLSHTLQDEVRTLRMIPVGNLLCTFPRYIRDLSHELNKQVELVITGDEIKVDKAVLEGLKDPIIHLLRNAVDHGIEDAKEREAKGKSKIGHIAIEIKEEAGNILIQVKDDGAGIDVKQIASVAENKNHLSKQDLEKLTENEVLQLIFNPMFSTKNIITDVSGRGVGLDVVKSNIESLNGQVNLSTELGKSTTFTLSVPLSISSERGLLVAIDDQYFVIPTSSVERIVLVKRHEIVDIQGAQAILLGERTIPVRLLSDIINIEKKSLLNEDVLPAVLIKKGNNTIAFFIDEIVGEREIVLKPLQEPLSKVACVAGGTLLDSNKVIVVLEPADLVSTALQHNKANRIESSEEKISDADNIPHILVVDDSITTRTLEKSVLESKNYRVTVAVNGKEAWDILQKQKFSLLITDVMMPIMDGFTLTDRVKKSENFSNLPVIIVTSLGSEAEKKRGIEVGADAYIIKNEFESGALLDIVSQLI